MLKKKELSVTIHSFIVHIQSLIEDCKKKETQTWGKRKDPYLTLARKQFLIPQRAQRSSCDGKQLPQCFWDFRNANQLFQSAAHLLHSDILETACYKQNCLVKNAVPGFYNKVHQLYAFIRTNCSSFPILELLKDTRHFIALAAWYYY